MFDVCFEPEAVGDRKVKSGPLVLHRAMTEAVVGTDGVDVEVTGSGSLLGRSGCTRIHVAALVEGAHVESDSLDLIP